MFQHQYITITLNLARKKVKCECIQNIDLCQVYSHMTWTFLVVFFFFFFFPLSLCMIGAGGENKNSWKNAPKQMFCSLINVYRWFLGHFEVTIKG